MDRRLNFGIRHVSIFLILKMFILSYSTFLLINMPFKMIRECGIMMFSILVMDIEKEFVCVEGNYHYKKLTNY